MVALQQRSPVLLTARPGPECYLGQCRMVITEVEVETNLALVRQEFDSLDEFRAQMGAAINSSVRPSEVVDHLLSPTTTDAYPRMRIQLRMRGIACRRGRCLSTCHWRS